MTSNSNTRYFWCCQFCTKILVLKLFHLSHLMSCAHGEGRSGELWYVYLFWKERGGNTTVVMENKGTYTENKVNF